eukprot:2333410-Alexandrium_andersonii.AAC.1
MCIRDRLITGKPLRVLPIAETPPSCVVQYSYGCGLLHELSNIPIHEYVCELAIPTAWTRQSG